uniref:Uncharacterized protein n=1 Tax=uncultured virus TaxID=340016 RepID=D5L252_9VIRU|nr:hypothetical protein [uncultured virus]
MRAKEAFADVQSVHVSAHSDVHAGCLFRRSRTVSQWTVWHHLERRCGPEFLRRRTGDHQLAWDVSVRLCAVDSRLWRDCDWICVRGQTAGHIGGRKMSQHTQPQPQLTPWQVVEIVADESDADVTGELTIADKATVRWQEAD